MADNEEKELFRTGDSVWLKEFEGDHESAGEYLLEALGRDKYIVDEVITTTVLSCRHYHPQVLVLKDEDGKFANLFLFEGMPISGFWFTKIQPPLEKALLTDEEIEKVRGWMDDIDTLMMGLNDDETVVRINQEARKFKLSFRVAATTQILRELDPPKVFVEGGQILPGTFTVEDDEMLKDIYKMFPEE
jgi:hypothetical protein